MNPSFTNSTELIPSTYAFPFTCTKNIKLTVTPEMCDQLDAIARAKCSSRLHMIRHAIHRFIAEQESC
jgi:metal-responsive CopG/Arc/MetJ family transcriptional regulator